MTLNEWFDDVKSKLVSDKYYTKAQVERMDAEDWSYYYESGYTPQDAVYENELGGFADEC